MKIKAYQVAPEHQEAFAFEDMCDNTIIIAGNNRLNGWKIDEYNVVYDALYYGENPCEEGEDNFTAWEKLISDSTEQVISDEKVICMGLKLLTGEEWEYKELRGCNQSDWNGCYYLAYIWTMEQLDALEMEYFNIGTEWTLEDEDGENWGNVYTHYWSDDENRAEIATAVGVEPEDVALYLFDGWTKAAKYKEV